MTLRLRALTQEEDQVLRRICRSGKEGARIVERAHIIRFAHEGRTSTDIARRMHMSKGR